MDGYGRFDSRSRAHHLLYRLIIPNVERRDGLRQVELERECSRPGHGVYVIRLGYCCRVKAHVDAGLLSCCYLFFNQPELIPLPTPANLENTDALANIQFDPQTILPPIQALSNG